MATPKPESTERSQSKASKRSSKSQRHSKKAQQFEGQPPPSRRRTDGSPPQSRQSLLKKSNTGPPGFHEPPPDGPKKAAAPSSLAQGNRAPPSWINTHVGHPHQGRSAANPSRAQTLPPMHPPASPSRASTHSLPVPTPGHQWAADDKQLPDRSHTHAGYPQSAASKGMPRSQSLPPIKSPRTGRDSVKTDIDFEIDGKTLPRSPSVISRRTLLDPEMLGSQRFLDQVVEAAIDPDGPGNLPREKYFESPTPIPEKPTPLPEIQTKEPRHPRNIFINKKIVEMEELTRKLKAGPWVDDDIPWKEAIPEKKPVVIEGPYTLDEIIYEENENVDDADALRKEQGRNPDPKPEDTRRGFHVPLAYDHETGEIKGEIAKAAAIMASATVDPTESKPAADPTLPNTCDCCADMNEHTKHLAALERDNPRPRVYQAKKLDEALGEKAVEATGYYRSDSPVLIPVSSFMDRDLASEEMLKVGVAKEMVDRLKQIARPQDLSVNQVPWPFYAHDMASTNDLAQYLETGLPAATDALIQVNIGEANSKYKDSMGRLERVMKKFQKY